MREHTAKAAVLTQAGSPLEIRSYPVLEPAADMALLSLRMSGICGTDLHIIEGRLPVPLPLILGHEFVGTVERLGAGVRTDGLGRPLAAGDTAIACVALPCGCCHTCAQGGTANCLSFGVSNFHDPAQVPHLFGGFAEALHQPARTLVRVPPGLPVDTVAALPCAGPTIIHAVQRAGGLKPGERVVVQGTGPVGLFAVAYAAAAGCRVAAFGSAADPARAQLARNLGAGEVWDYRAGTAAERAALVAAWAGREGGGNGADVVIEASGSPAAFPEGLGFVRTLGRYVVPGQYSLGGSVAVNPETITFKAVTIVGSSQYDLADIGAYLDFLAGRPALHKPLAACVTLRLPVARAAEACAAVAAGRAVKAVLVGEGA